jgi:AbrB family looped-hinge helix DNA binding protein
MKYTVKRCVDKLGRLVLPKDMRNLYGIHTGDTIEIMATEEGILLKSAVESPQKDTTEKSVPWRESL